MQSTLDIDFNIGVSVKRVTNLLKLGKTRATLKNGRNNLATNRVYIAVADAFTYRAIGNDFPIRASVMVEPSRATTMPVPCNSRCIVVST